MSSTDSITASFDLAQYLKLDTTQAFLADQIEESLLQIPVFNKLANVGNREFALEHFYYVLEEDEDDKKPGVWILCNREGEVQEATFFFTGVVTKHSLMPFATNKDLNKSEPCIPPFHQYVVCTMPGLKIFDDVVRAINTTYVMARLRLKEGLLKPMTNLVIDGEEAICAMTPISTPTDRMRRQDVRLELTTEQDPRFVLREFLRRRDHVVLEDNQVDVYLAHHREKAGEYELHGGASGALVRPGQIVRLEVGFRIVPAGHQYVHRMDLKSVVIINDDICAAMAFAEADAQLVKTRTISVSSAGPSGLTIKEKSRVKRASRKPKNVAKVAMDVDGLGELPFSTK